MAPDVFKRKIDYSNKDHIMDGFHKVVDDFEIKWGKKPECILLGTDEYMSICEYVRSYNPLMGYNSDGSKKEKENISIGYPNQIEGIDVFCV